MYREHVPPPHLRSLVECFWTSRSEGPLAGVRHHRVLPDNCADFIFDLGDPDVSSAPAPAPCRAPLPAGGARSYVVGTMRTALVVGRLGRVEVLGVRFLPGAAASVTGVPAHEITDATVPLDALFPDAPALADQLAEATPADRPELIAEAVTAWAGARDRTPDARVRHAIMRIQETGGTAPVEDVAEGVGLSTRQLERTFRRDVGISPKEAARVARLHRATTLIGSGPVSLAGAAYRVGYHDQSHMTREFRDLAGVTPAAYAAERDVGFVQDGEAARR